MQEMTELFSLESVNRSGSVFNAEKLDWVNQQHIVSMTDQELANSLLPYLQTMLPTAIFESDKIAAVAALQKDRCATLQQMAEESRYFFIAPDSYDEKAAAKQFKQAAIEPLSAVSDKFAALEDGQWQPENIDSAIKSTVEELGIGFGKIGLPLRVALTGNTKSPPLEQTVACLEKDEVLQRLATALEYIRAQA